MAVRGTPVLQTRPQPGTSTAGMAAVALDGPADPVAVEAAMNWSGPLRSRHVLARDDMRKASPASCGADSGCCVAAPEAFA